MLNQLLKKLIRNSAGQTKFVLAVIGLSIALILILSAVQLQSNYYELLNGKKNQDSIANFLVVNKSLNETLVRSINTSLTVLVTLLAIYFFGGESIRDFSLALLVGIFFGTYSSIFVASALLVTSYKLQLREKK